MRTAPSRVLVLGGTGLLGRAVVERFLTAGHPVTSLARGAADADRPGLRHVRAEVVDDVALRAACADVEHVVFAVGSASPAEAETQSPGAGPTRLGAVLRVLADRPAPVPVRLTYLSSGGCVYGEFSGRPAVEGQRCRPISAYGRGKLAEERLIARHAAHHGLTARVLRVANAYGPGQRVAGGQGLIAALLAAVRDGTEVTVFGGTGMVRDYLHADDVASAVVALDRAPAAPAVVNVGTGVGHTVAEVVDAVEQVTGVRPRVIHGAARGVDVRRSEVDVSRLRSLIAWTPRPLPVGIEATWRAGLAAESTATYA